MDRKDIGFCALMICLSIIMAAALSQAEQNTRLDKIADMVERAISYQNVRDLPAEAYRHDR